MNKTVLDGLKVSYTAYHAVDYAVKTLTKAGFTRLSADKEWKIEKGGKYFIIRSGSALIAFTAGETDKYYYRIISSHTDSPALKIKYDPVSSCAGQFKLDVEVYGGPIYRSFLDVPLCLAGSVVYETKNGLARETYTDPHTYIIPSVAIHFDRGVNDGKALNPQIDLRPLFGSDPQGDEVSLKSDERAYYEEYFARLGGGKVVGYDLYAVNATKPFFAGAKDEYICSPRLDNLVSAFSSVDALVKSDVKSGVNVAFLADSEEIGSKTAEGADSDFLRTVLRRINRALGKTDDEFDRAIASSFAVSADNAHATHPNHPELSDAACPVFLGGGVVIKHHANRNYTTSAFTGALFDRICEKAGVKTQDFFMRSDMRCGSTLGALSVSQISIDSVDIGVAQLAMHSSLETASVKDVDDYAVAMKAFYDSAFTKTENGVVFD